MGVGGAVLVLSLAGVAVASRSERGTEVRTETVTRHDLVSTVTATGRIDPKRKVDISADISGRVIQLAVEEGQTVSRGDLLLRIDPTSFEAAVRRAQAGVAQAQAQVAQARANVLQAVGARQRAERLAGSDELISGADLEQARTAAAVAQAQLEATRFSVAQAQATLAEAREALRKTTIVSPMSGRVTRLNIEEGETAVVGTMNNPGSLLLTVADLSVMEAVVRVDETAVPSISIGDSATVRIDAFPAQTFSGRVTRIANSSLQTPAGTAGAAAGTAQAVDFEVVITLDTPPAELRPDLSATADIITAHRPNTLAVPILALTVRDSSGRTPKTTDAADLPPGTVAGPQRAGATRSEVEGVFVVRDGKAAWVPVQVGIAGDRYFEVVRGLAGGEPVVSGSYQAVRDLQAGDAVRLPEAKETARSRG
jgi:HlyD family secretion protein